MNLIFICKGNVARSQIAPAFFNLFSEQYAQGRHHAEGAGTHVGEKEGEHLHPFVVQCMAEVGYDLSQNVRRQLTPKMASEADRFIVMAKREDVPPYIPLEKTVFWSVEDTKGLPYEAHCASRDRIKTLVEDLVKELG